MDETVPPDLHIRTDMYSVSFFYNKQLIGTLNSYICFFNETDKIFTAVICYEIDGVFFVCKNFIRRCLIDMD